MAWAITNATALNPTLDGDLQEVAGATIVMQDGKIAAVGKGISPPEGCEVLDASGSYALPGFIDACTRLGVREDAQADMGWDDEETEKPFNPLLKATDAVWPEDLAFADARRAGVTTVAVLPGTKAIVSGQGGIVKTIGTTIDDMCIRDPWVLRTNLFKSEDRTPAEAIRHFRRTLLQAQHRLDNPGEDDDPSPGDEVWGKVLSGELPLLCRVNDYRDILNLVDLGEEFGFTIIFERLTEGYYATSQLQEEPGVLVGPILLNRRGDTRNTSLQTPRVMHEAGIPVALTTDHPTLHISYITVAAAAAVSEGLSEGAALAAMTRVPARILGMEDRLGGIEVGKDADIAVFSDRPLKTRSALTHLFIDGEPVDLTEGSDD